MSEEKAAPPPVLCEPSADDQTVLLAVVDHYQRCLEGNEKAKGALAKLAIDEETASRYRVGVSDRSLGLRLPSRQLKHGGELRAQLIRLGLYRRSGHEHLVGCLVVPVIACDGRVVGFTGRRIDRGDTDLFTDKMNGSWFNEKVIGDGVLLASSIFEALAIVGAGHDAVIAVGHGGAMTEKDARALANKGIRSVTLVGADGDGAIERFTRHGIECTRTEHRGGLIQVLQKAHDRGAALSSLLTATIPSLPTKEQHAAAKGEGGAPSVSGNRAELHVGFAARTWRARSASRDVVADVLRVALSVSDLRSGRIHLDTLDLYQSRARASFVAAATVELHANGEELNRELTEVIFAVERAQGTVINEEQPDTMTSCERDAAMELLGDPNLMDRVRRDLSSLGVVGEATNLLVAYLSTISRKAERPFGVVIQSSSAAGKSTLADAIASLVPKEDLASYSAITGQALYYLGADDLCRKVLFVSEEQGASRATYALKLLVTEGRLAIASAGKDPDTGQLRTRQYSIEGPVAMLMTTTATDIDPELQNRLVVLGVDEDRSQTRAIHAAQRHNATLDGLLARLHRSQITALHQNAQRLLEALPVVIPDAMALSFPDFATRHRRDHQKLLSLIGAITLLHQYQRTIETIEVGGTIVRYVEASASDVALGCQLGEELLVRGADELAPQARRLLWVIEHEVNKARTRSPLGMTFTRRELRELTGWSEHQVRVGLERLVALEYVLQLRSRSGLQHRYQLASNPATPSETPRPPRDIDSRGVFGQSPGETDRPAGETRRDKESTENVDGDGDVVGDRRVEVVR